MPGKSASADKPSADLDRAHGCIKPKQNKMPSPIDPSIATASMTLGPPVAGHCIARNEVSTEVALATIDMADLDKLRRWLQERSVRCDLYSSNSPWTATAIRELGFSMPVHTHAFDRDVWQETLFEGALVWERSPRISSYEFINRPHASKISVQQSIAHPSRCMSLCEPPDVSGSEWPFAEVPQS